MSNPLLKSVLGQVSAQEITRRVASDERSDDGQRIIHIARHGVTIERRVHGVKMRLFVPAKSFCGVILSSTTTGGRPSFVVCLTHRDPDLCVEVSESGDVTVADGLWRYWSHYFGRPALSDVAAEDTQRQAFDRRRPAGLGGRRSEFSLQRPLGDLARLDSIIRSEREIIRYD